MKIIESGKCGDNVSYELTEDGVLRIFGIGGIFNYNHEYFYKKENIKQVIIAKGVTMIGNCAFKDCTLLKLIDIPNSVTRIGSGVFEGCTSLESIVIPNGVTEIGNSAFEGCTSLKLINIPNSVTNIGWFAFEGCTSLESIVIPNGVTEIGISTFEGCTSLKSIDIPNSVTEISGCAFKNTAWLNDQPDGVIYINDVLYKYKGVMLENIHIKIKDGITQICNSAFEGCTSLESIVIPNGVTEIGISTFKGCTSLKSINIPTSVTNIGWSVFEGCTSLEAIDIPNSVTKISSNAFGGCTSLKSINVDVLNDNYLSEKGVLYNKDKSLLIRYPSGKLESLFVVPNSVAEIDSGAFEGCTSLKSIDIPNSVTEIGYKAFYGCTSLESIVIPNSIIKIEKSVFELCTALKLIDIPNSVVTIEDKAFDECRLLNTIHIPSKCSFYCCRNFIGRETIISSATEPFKMKCKYRKCGPYERLNFSIPVYVPKGSKKAYHEHEEWGKFTNIKEIDGRCGEDSYYELLGNGTLNIFGKDEMYDDFVFDKSKIKKVRVTENICMIGANAFKDCRKLRIVEIESPLEEIADGAFSGCENIFSMTIASEIPPIVSEHTLEGLMRTIEIRVPANAIRYYKAAKYWNEFTNYVAID